MFVRGISIIIKLITAEMISPEQLIYEQGPPLELQRV